MLWCSSKRNEMKEWDGNCHLLELFTFSNGYVSMLTAVALHLYDMWCLGWSAMGSPLLFCSSSMIGGLLQLLWPMATDRYDYKLD